MNLFEILREAGGGRLFQQLGSTYGLSEELMSEAVRALLPIFSAGLKQSTADPFALAEFLRRIASGEYLKAFQNPDWARVGDRKAGEDALTFLFGSPEAVLTLGKQAEALAKLAPETLKDLMTTLAPILLGGIGAQSAAL